MNKGFSNILIIGIIAAVVLISAGIGGYFVFVKRGEVSVSAPTVQPDFEENKKRGVDIRIVNPQDLGREPERVRPPKPISTGEKLFKGSIETWYGAWRKLSYQFAYPEGPFSVASATNSKSELGRDSLVYLYETVPKKPLNKSTKEILKMILPGSNSDETPYETITHTLNVFFDSTGEFTSDKYFDEVIKSRCPECEKTINSLNIRDARDMATFANTGFERGKWILFRGGSQWFFVIELKEPAEEAGKILSTFVFSESQLPTEDFAAGWKLYTNPQAILRFHYPPNLSFTKTNNGEVRLIHSIPYKHGNPCDFRGDGTPLDHFVDFDVTLKIAEKGLAELYNGGFSLEDKVRFDELTGYSSWQGVEGCGRIIYYFPLASGKTLIIERALISEFSGDAEYDKEFYELPAVITPPKAETLFKQILWTIEFSK